MMRNPSPPRLLFAIAATAALATAASGAAAAAPPSAFVCNAASRKAGTPKPLPVPVVTVADQFATLAATVKQVDRLCTPATTTGTPPADVATHLVRRSEKAAGPAATIRGVAVENALGAHALDLGRASGNE